MKLYRALNVLYLTAIFFALAAPLWAIEWEWQNPMPQGNTFRAVWGTSGTNVFAVGEKGVIFHNDGSKWTRIYQPLEAVSLYGIWGTSENNMFFVGDQGTIIHYDGNTWTKMSSGTPFPLYGIWGNSKNDIFAIGSYGMIIHYDGNSWSKMNTGISDKRLRGIWGNAGDNIFVVGDNGIILHYDGVAWTQMNSTVSNVLAGIWGSSSDEVYAVGGAGTILRYDGSAWSKITNPAWDTLNSIWGTSPSNIFAVGSSGVLLHFDGTNWKNMSSPMVGHYSVWGSSAINAFTVGEAGEILEYKGNIWNKIYPTADSFWFWIRSGIRISDNLSFVVGQGKQILSYDGSIWKETNPSATGMLYSIWGEEWTDVFTVGTSGTILRYDGNSWKTMNSGTTAQLNSIHGISKDNILTAGNTGTILRYDGNAWTSMSSGTSENLNGVWMASDNKGFAVGNNGTILVCNGSLCSAMASPTTRNLYCVWGTSETDVYAAGEYGKIFHYNGSSWTDISSAMPPTANPIYYSIGGSSANDVFIAGGLGTILHYNGTVWTKMNSDTQHNIYSIWGDSQTEIFVGGSGGMILHHSPIFVSPRAINIKEPDGSDTLNIRLTSEPSADVTVKLYTSNPSECTVSPEFVTLNKNNWLNGVAATVKAEYDGIADGNQLCRIFTANAESTDSRYNGIDPADVTVTVADDSPGVALFSVYPASGITGQNLAATIKGQGFDADTKLYLHPITGGSDIPLTWVLKDSNTINVTIPAQSVGDYTIKASGASNSFELVSAVTFADPIAAASQAGKKAIIVAGGPYQDNVLWKSSRKCANHAYFTLYSQGYTDDSIYYLSIEPYDVNGDGKNDVDGYTNLSGLSYALTNWAKNNTDEVLIYMVGIGESGSFTLNEKEKLDASVLAGWLDNLQSAIPGKLMFIYDASMSGSFIPALKTPPGKQRITIASAAADQTAWFLDDGELSFSYHFWTSVFNSGKFYQAYDYTKARLLFSQMPMADTNGDGSPDTSTRSKRENITDFLIGLKQRYSSTSSPVIGSVSPAQTLYIGQSSAELWAGDITAPNRISRVEAKIYPPETYCPKELIGSVSPYLRLLPDTDDKYKNTYTDCRIVGNYDMYVYATDMKDYRSLPAKTAIDKKNTEPPIIPPDDPPVPPPTECTGNVSASHIVSVNAISAVVTGYVPKCLLDKITERGFFWWNADKASGAVPAVNAGNEETYRMTITGLNPSASYNVGAYARTSAGELLLDKTFLTFTTSAPCIPTVMTDSKYIQDGRNITLKGEITDVGSSPITIYGFVYAKHPFPTVWDMALPFTWDMTLPISVGKPFEGTIKNLSVGTYYLRAYAHNSQGTAYGQEISVSIADSISIDTPGNLSGDNAIDLADIIIALKILADIPVSNLNLKADVNGDGKIGSEEAVYILQKVSGVR